MNDLQTFFVFIAVGVAVWGAVELYLGKVYFLPNRYHPGMTFTREDDPGVFWFAAVAKIGGALYLAFRVFGA